MRKDKRVLLILCVFCLLFLCTLTGAGCNSTSNDKEFVAEGETTLIENPTKDPSAYTAKQQLYILAWQLKNINSYKSIIEGQTESKMPKYVQHINNVHIKNGDESFSGAKSTSFLVNVGKQAFFKGDKVVCREATDVLENAWSENLNVTTLEEYRSKMGNEATAFTNYILNDETILKAESKKLESGEYQIVCEIDPNKGTDRYKVQMMNYGGLKNKPEFNSCGFTVTFNSDWMPSVLVSNDDYNIDKGILKLHCVSTLTETFSEFNKELTIPNGDLFREKINDNTSDLDEEDIVEGNELLFNTILQMDTSKGIKINGTLDAEMNGKAITLPIDGWMTFDFHNYPNGDLNQVFTGYVTTNINNIGVSIIYIGDDYLYINLGGTKYKYLLTDNSSDSEINFDEIIQTIVIEEQERIDNFRKFNLSVSPLVLNAMSKVISDFTSKLPDNFNALNDLAVKDLTMGITLIKKSPSTARITEVTLDGDFNIAKGHASVLIAEKPEKLPTAEDLNDYVEADWENLMTNFQFAFKVMNGFNGYDWATGTGFTLNAGLYSEGTASANLLFPLPMTAQFGENGLRAHLTFALGALMKMPNEIFYENGSLYLVTCAGTGKDAIASKVELINLTEKLGALLPGLVYNGNFNVQSILNVLSQVVLNSKVENTKLEDGTERFELYLPQELVEVIDKAYAKLIQMAKGMDTSGLGAMAPLVSQLLMLFEFKLDHVIIRTEFKDDKMTSFSLRLKNDNTSLAAAGKDLSLIIELMTFKNLEEGFIEDDFSVIERGLAAMEESKDVRTLFDNILATGLNHVGPSMGKVLTDAMEKYNALSANGKATVTTFAEFKKMNDLYTKLNKEANDFINALKEIEALTKEGSKDKEINDLLLTVLNPVYNAKDERQYSFIGSYAIEKYLEYRCNNEKVYLTKEIMTMIDKLNAENYPTSKELNDAINEANKLYLGLLEDNRALVTNYDKISEAKKIAHELELKEFDNDVLKETEKLNAITNKTDYNALKAEKANLDKVSKKYDELNDEDKKAITNYQGFKAASDKFFTIVGELYTEAYNNIGGDDKIVAGDEIFNKIDKTTKLGFLFSTEQKTSFKDKMDKVTAWSQKHRGLETKLVIDAITAIGKIEFTEESHNKLIAARNALNGIRKQYFGSVSNRGTLSQYEIDYVLLSIGDLTVDTVTKEDAETINNARKLYTEATTAYKTQAFFQRGIVNKLADFNKNLTAMEAKIK